MKGTNTSCVMRNGQGWIVEINKRDTYDGEPIFQAPTFMTMFFNGNKKELNTYIKCKGYRGTKVYLQWYNAHCRVLLENDWEVYDSEMKYKYRGKYLVADRNMGKNSIKIRKDE